MSSKFIAVFSALRSIVTSRWNQRFATNLQNTYARNHSMPHRHITDAFFAYHSTSAILTEKISDHIDVAAEQSTDDALSRIISVLQTNDLNKNIDPNDDWAPLLMKTIHQFYLESGTFVLIIRDSKHPPKLVVLFCHTNSVRNIYIKPMVASTTRVSPRMNFYPATGWGSKLRCQDVRRFLWNML